MKTKFIVLLSAAVLIAACCGGGSQTASSDKDKASCCDSTKKECCKVDELKKVISAQVFIKPEKVDEFLAQTKDLLELSNAEEGCISYNLFQSPIDKSVFLFFEEWKNQAAVDFHFDTEHFKKFGETLNECSSKAAIIKVYSSVNEKEL